MRDQQSPNLTERTACATASAVLHAALLFFSGFAIQRETTADVEFNEEPQRPLIVTAFLFEDPREPAGLHVFSFQSSLANASVIVAPLPKLPDLAPLASDSFERSEMIASIGDLQQAERLQGLYLGQIKARLLRLLEDSSPRGYSADASCVVHIMQDERGEVFDVMTDECHADSEWRSGVAQAIREASPLPTPPQGLAMGSYLTLDLTSLWEATHVADQASP